MSGPGSRAPHLVCGHKVAHEQQDAHDDVLRDGYDIRARYFEHLDPALDCRVQIDVVRADTRCDADLQVLSL